MGVMTKIVGGLIRHLIFVWDDDSYQHAIHTANTSTEQILMFVNKRQLLTQPCLSEMKMFPEYRRVVDERDFERAKISGQ